jgi:hypothetical protein
MSFIYPGSSTATSLGLITLAGDISGTAAVPAIISLTGSAGVIPIAATGAAITWNTATVNPTITQATAVGVAGHNLTIAAQSGDAGGDGAGNLILQGGTDPSLNGLNGSVYINYAGGNSIIIDGTGLTVDPINEPIGVVGISTYIGFVPVTANSDSTGGSSGGGALIYQAQNTGTANGADIWICSQPSGSSATSARSGNIILAVPPAAGTTSQAYVKISSVLLNPNNAGTTVATICIGKTLTTNQMSIFFGTFNPSATNYGIGGTTSALLINASTSITMQNAGVTTVATFLSTGTQFSLPISGASATPLQFLNSAVTLATSGTTTLSAAQQGSPNLTPATVTLVGNATLAFNGIIGTFWLNLSNVTYAGFTLTLTNGAGTLTLPAGTTFVTVQCLTASTIQIEGTGITYLGTILPASLTWGAAVAAPTIQQTAAVSGAGANMTIAPQAATTTGASGSLVLGITAPASGTAEGGLVLKRGSTTLATWQPFVSGPTTYSSFYAGGVTPGASNYGFLLAADGTVLNLNASTSVTILVGATSLAAFTTTTTTLRTGIVTILGSIGNTVAPGIQFTSSAVTLATSGTTTLTSAQTGTPNLTPAVVTLTGNATLAIGGTIGTFWLDLSNVTYAGFSLTLTNGAGTVVVPTGSNGIITVKCQTASTISISSSVATSATGTTSTPFQFGNSSVTIPTSGTASTLTGAQQATPNLTIAAVILSGAVTLPFGGVVGTFWLNIRNITFGAFGLTLSNGAGSVAIPAATIATGNIVTVVCSTSALIDIG